ncbi:MAG: zinc ribbon-containing protein [Gammaproteobacteria bacterium]|nr:zinc ribbon-containing protein [Gammaproteobacteria bacterium]
MSAAQHQNDNSLIDAYNKMMARIQDAIETAEHSAVPTLQKAIEMAQKQAIHLDEITAEEANKIGNYIKRDINDAAEYLMETSHEFSEWLMLDIDVIEQKVLELFLSVADRTRLELEQFSRPACEISMYHTGEITGPGSLVCTRCSRLIHFKTTGQIPPCPECQYNEFRRAEI